MYAFVTSLFAILPLASARPLLRRTHTCTLKSEGDFAWTVESFDFHASYIFSTPAHQNSWGYVNFNLSNPALDYQAACSAASDQLEGFYYGNMAYHCTFPEGVENPGSATFSFSRPFNVLDILQSWTCYDDPQYPTTFTGWGNTTLTLDCADTTWQNPDWQEGQIYSDRDIKCGLVTMNVKPYQMTAVA